MLHSLSTSISALSRLMHIAKEARYVFVVLKSHILVCVAGLSLGEYCALVFAGVLTFEEGLKIVKVRAESMAAAAMSGQWKHKCPL